MAQRFVTSNPKWMCVSPMTHHVLRDRAPGLRRARSRSFNDYITHRDTYRQSGHYNTSIQWSLQEAVKDFPPEDLGLPPLEHLVPPKGGLPATVTSAQPSFPVADMVAQESSPLIPGRGRPNPPSPSINKMVDSQNSGVTPWYIDVLYGCINATIIIPIIMSFGNIIYQDPFFQPYTPILIKLTLVSGVVHQMVFSTLSSLPFAVGSVQDAGLIFLSAMARDMVAYCQEEQKGNPEDYPDAEQNVIAILATVTVGLALATALLGVGLIIIGNLRLAGYVQMLPTCVVAGYLAFIGWFCGKSGLGIMTNEDQGGVGGGDDSDDDGATFSMLGLFFDQWYYLLPGIVGGLFIYGSVQIFRHVAVLPTCIAILLTCFYAGLWVSGSSIIQATHNGWIREAEAAPVWYQTWQYLTHWDLIIWSAYPQCFLTEFSMLLVVALSSSLDVAAVELELLSQHSRTSEEEEEEEVVKVTSPKVHSGPSLNYDKELTMVGLSNLISGLTGGYTGSYIFSQTIFSLRAGIRSRLAGYVLSLVGAFIIVTPIPILSYVPNFLYGSLLIMISLDLMYEWLWDFRTKVTVAEYWVGLSSFGMIQWLGVEYGILAGVAIYALCRQCGINVGELKLATNDTIQDDDDEKEKEPTTPRPEPSKFMNGTP